MVFGAGCILSRRRAARAAATAVSPWAGTGHARVRLIDAGALAGARRLAGIEIALDPDFLTYWRTPGEAGVPPTADFAGSTNLAGAALKFPAPDRFDEGGVEAYGYKARVVFPVLVEPMDAGRPVDLAMALSFAICAKLCLPVQANCALELSADSTSSEAESVREALARVPMPQTLGAAGPLAIDSIALSPDGDSIVAVARAGSDAVLSLFPEAPEPWFVQADAGTPADAGLTRFTLKILNRPPGKVTTLPLRLTLVSDTTAVEVAADLDVAPRRP